MRPTQSSAIAERVSSNINLLHAQVLEAIREQRKKLDAFETLMEEANERVTLEIARTCELAESLSNALKSDEVLIDNLKIMITKEVT